MTRRTQRDQQRVFALSELGLQLCFSSVEAQSHSLLHQVLSSSDLEGMFIRYVRVLTGIVTGSGASHALGDRDQFIRCDFPSRVLKKQDITIALRQLEVRRH
jgi:hypothetical protein